MDACNNVIVDVNINGLKMLKFFDPDSINNLLSCNLLKRWDTPVGAILNSRLGH